MSKSKKEISKISKAVQLLSESPVDLIIGTQYLNNVVRNYFTDTFVHALDLEYMLIDPNRDIIKFKEFEALGLFKRSLVYWRKETIDKLRWKVSGSTSELRYKLAKHIAGDLWPSSDYD